MASSDPAADWATAGRTWLGGLGAATLVAVLAWAAGPVGGLIGIVIAGLWYVLPAPYAVGIAHLGLLLLPDPSVEILVGVEAGFLAVLAGPMVREIDWPPKVLTLGLLATGLGSLAWFGWRAWQPRWLVAVAVTAIVALGVYTVHRYTLITIELHGGDPTP